MKLAALMAMLGAAQTEATQAPVPDPYCEDLRLVVVAAEEPRPFASLATKRLNLGLNARCRVAGPEHPPGFHCEEVGAGSPIRREALAARTAACLPGALRGPEPPPPADPERARFGDAGETRFRLPGIEIVIQNTSAQSRVGYRLWLSVLTRGK